MEASVAAGTSGQPAGADGQPAQQQNGDGQQTDFQSVLEAQLGPINQQMEETRQFLQSQPWLPQDPNALEGEAASPELPSVDLSAFDETAPGYDPAQAAQHLQDMIDQRAAAQAQQLVERQLAPVQEAQDELRRERAAEMLATKYPDLQKAEVAKEVLDASAQKAQELGRPELAMDPSFWEMNLLSLRAIQMSQADGAETSQPAVLEGAAGASPGAQQGTATQAVDRIFGAGRTNPLPFK